MVQICQTIRYCTSRNCRNSSRVDCLSICVSPQLKILSVSPQLKILSQVLHKIREKASVLLIAPYWPNGPWFPNLLEILTAPLWLIPLRQDPLFLCFGGSTKGQPVSKQRLSHWVVDRLPWPILALEWNVLLGVRAHSTRAIASSWAWTKGVSIKDICMAAGWSSQNTFARFYHLDVWSLASQVLSVSATHGSTCNR